MCIIHVLKVKCRSTLKRRVFQGVLKLCCLYRGAAIRHVLHKTAVCYRRMLTQFDSIACDNLHVRLWSRVMWALLRVILLNTETVLPAVERERERERERDAHA